HKKVQHRGQELLFVVKGRIDIAFPHGSVRLGAGDCIVFGGQTPHRVLSLPPTRAEMLVIVTHDADTSQ
ncbi:MAG: cupin domain-containing protein, partial [Burkholderiales bacterium]